MIVTIFDWDDTLFATTYYKNIDLYTVKFPELSTSIIKCLSLALIAGSVYIITNGERAWVKRCIKRHLIGCDDIIERVHLVSTVDSGISKLTSLERCKIVAFSLIAGHFNKRGSMHHLICFGDCDYDREAAETMRIKISDTTYIKNIKMLRKPNLKILLAQHNLIHNIYNTLLLSNQNLDIKISPSILPIKYSRPKKISE
jgi:hypothetical protein